MDLKTAKSKLNQRLLELTGRAAEIEEKLSDPGDPDWAENAVEMEDDEVRIGIGEMAKSEIREIERALFRIDKGTYGKCEACGEPISQTRLELLPHVANCIQCADS